MSKSTGKRVRWEGVDIEEEEGEGGRRVGNK